MAAPRRKNLRSAHHSNLPVGQNVKTQFVRAATSPAAKATYVVIGSIGLAALAIAIFGPKRFERQVLKPVQNKVSDQAAQIWNDSKPLREQIVRLFERAQSESGREKLVRSFQSWLGHFKAT